MRVRRHFMVCLVASAVGGAAACSRQAAPVASPAQGASGAVSASARTVGTSCDLSGGLGTTGTAPGVFIELAGAQGQLSAILRDHPPPAKDPAPTAGFEAFIGDPRLKSLGVYHVLTPTDVPQSVAWELEGRDGAKERLDITLTPHVSGPAPGGVSIDVDVRGRAHTTVVVRDQQSIFLDGFSVPLASGTQAVFVLTPYVLWNDADFTRLLECKGRRARPGIAAGSALP